MKVLLFSGLLYLAGVATILYFRPTLMFRDDGSWKEFGIGRNSAEYTWMPFWLAAILWAVICYLTVMILSDAFGTHTLRTVDLRHTYPGSGSTTARNMKRASTAISSMEDGAAPGYYRLESKGRIPRYIYVGEAPPAEFEGGDGE